MLILKLVFYLFSRQRNTLNLDTCIVVTPLFFAERLFFDASYTENVVVLMLYTRKGRLLDVYGRQGRLFNVLWGERLIFRCSMSGNVDFPTLYRRKARAPPLGAPRADAGHRDAVQNGAGLGARSRRPAPRRRERPLKQQTKEKQ